MPREHGAWGILLIPFATAVGVSGVFDLPVWLLLLSVLGFYLARTSFLKSNRTWTLILIGGGAAAGLPLVLVWKLWWLVLFAAAAAPLAFRKMGRSVAMQLLAVAGLTLTAPAAWYAATGHLGEGAFVLWLLNALYFGGGVFYVRMHLEAAIRRGGSRWRLGAPVLGYYGATCAGLAGLGSAGLAPWMIFVAFAPAVTRAMMGVMRLSAVLRIKRLGWTEVAYSLVYLAGLVWALRTY